MMPITSGSRSIVSDCEGSALLAVAECADLTNPHFIFPCFGQRIYPADAQQDLIDGNFVRCAEVY